MRIILCGVPETGKHDFSVTLFTKYGIDASGDICDLLLDLYEHRAPAAGFLADYRLELFLASFRAIEHVHEQNMVFVNSLLDSIAYATTITALKIQTNDSEVNTWLNCFHFFPKLIEDSFLYDLVIRFPYTGDDEMMKILDSNLELAITNFEIPYVLSTDLDTIYAKIEEEHEIDEHWNVREADALGI